MRINGYFNAYFKPKAPTLNLTLHFKSLGVKHRVRFLIDTGASVTLLLDKDVLSCGLDINTLTKSHEQISGIGGSVTTYKIPDVEIIFETSEGMEYKETITLYVGIHDLSQCDEKTKRKILMMPSLLGRDVLNTFKLFCAAEEEAVYLEK